MRRIKGLSRNTLVLGWVSLFTDMSSEIVYPLLPLFLVIVLGADKSLVGLIEGMAESTASLLKLISGWIADKTRRNKGLVTLGYSISTLSKPLFLLAGSPWPVLGIRFMDRVGKGVRTAPRDVLISETTAPEFMGRAFGLHRAMDTIGAVIGPLLAVWLLGFFHGDYRLVFASAAIPGALAVLLILWGVKDLPARPSGIQLPRFSWKIFDRRFHWFIAAAFIFGLANSSNAFLLLRAKNLGIPVHFIPIAYLLYNLVYVFVSLPAGILSDRLGRPRILLLGYVSYALIYLGFGFAASAWQAWMLLAAYGLYSGLTDGVARAWVKELAPGERQGAAYGLYHFAMGVVALPASVMAGALWDAKGPAMMFEVDAALAIVAIALFIVSWRSPRTQAAAQ